MAARIRASVRRDPQGPAAPGRAGAPGALADLRSRLARARDRFARSRSGRLLGGFGRSVTPLGRAVGLVGVLAWIGAAFLGWQELAVLGVACFVGLGAGVVMLAFGRAKLAVLLDLGTKRVVVGDPATTRVEARNDSSRRTLPVRLEAMVGRGVAHLQVPSLGAGTSHDELFVIPTERRAVVPVGPVRSVQGDPLGLVRREVVWTGTEHLYIHPKTVVLGSLATGWIRDLEGETTNDRSPNDVAFHTLREYVVGDDRRHIHWRTTARNTGGKLMVKEFVDTRRAGLGLVLSLRSGDYGSDEAFELAVSAAASMGVRALADEQQVVLVAGRRVLPSFHGASFLDALTGVELGSDDLDVSAATSMALGSLGAASVAAVIVGAGADEGLARQAADRLGPSVRTMVVTAEPGADSAFGATAGVSRVRLGDLADLPRLVWTVTNR